MQGESIPYGYCQCGCGEKAPVADRSRSDLGMQKGDPFRFILGHHLHLSPHEYLADPLTGCWVWQRGKDPNGYGKLRVNGRMTGAHRVVYERHLGPIPEGLELDHLCRNRACVNPDHLEPVLHRENMLRGESLQAQNAHKTHCKRGHPLEGDNAYSSPGRNERQCRTCQRWRQRKNYAEAKGWSIPDAPMEQPRTTDDGTW